MIEKNELFAILRSVNYWNRDLDLDYVSRPIYLDKIIQNLQNKSILVIQGPRRVGKTVLLRLTIQNLLQSIDSKQILYVNFEDFRFYKHYSLELLDLIYTTYREEINPNKPMYFLLDEIQNISGFERFLRTKYDLLEESIKFIITGSNSTLLSKGISSLLTGRFMRFEIFPFSFREFLRYHKECSEVDDTSLKDYFDYEPQKTKLKYWLNQYYKTSAIPEYFENPSQERLQEYFDNILLKDVVELFNLRNIKVIKDLGIYLLSNATKLISHNSLVKTFDVSINTVKNYLDYLESAFLFFPLKKFSFSYSKQVTSPSKIYCVDNGLMQMVGFQFSKNQGRLFENLVFLELKRTGKEIYYFRGKGECDFIIRENLKVIDAIQVTTQMNNKKTREREFNGLIGALEEFELDEGYIVTEDEYANIKKNNYTIKIRPLWFWLLNKN